MNMSIKELHKLTELSILTPYNLLENIKLPEYETINYSKKAGNIECVLTGSTGFCATYIFDSNNALQTATILYEEELIEVFNREKEKRMLLSKIKGQASDVSSKVAI